MFVVDLARRLADTLRQLRREAGLTQAEVARRLGVSHPTLNRLESGGQDPTLRTLSQLCRALCCEPGDLFTPGRATLRSGRSRRRGGADHARAS